MLYFSVCIWSDSPEQAKHHISSGSTPFATHPVRCLHTKGEYGKVTDIVVFGASCPAPDMR